MTETCNKCGDVFTEAWTLADHMYCPGDLYDELNEAVNELVAAVEATATWDCCGQPRSAVEWLDDPITVPRPDWQVDPHDTSDDTTVIETAADNIAHRLEH